MGGRLVDGRLVGGRLVDGSSPRRRDAERTREQLLAVARVLFADRGFERTTVREIGEQAGADPALIARYFGSKAGLYVAALRSELGGEVPAALLEAGRRSELLARLQRQGGGPVLQAAVRVHDDPDVQAAAAAELQRRLVEPLRLRLERDGGDRAELRAAVAVAAFAGVALARAAGTLAGLAEGSAQDVEDAVTDLLHGLLDGRRG